MKFSVLEKNLINHLESSIRDTTPGVMVRAYQGGRIICDVAVGNTFAYYDLASLTKVLFTTQAMMLAFEEGHWNFETKVSEVLPWFENKETKITQLMTHTSGLTWWTPAYEQMDLNASIEKRHEDLKKILMSTKTEPQDKDVY